MGSDVTDALTEVKMSQTRKRCACVNEQKTYKRGDRVTVLGLVCEQMAKRVLNVRKESEERQAAAYLSRMPVLSEARDDECLLALTFVTMRE